MLRCPLPRCQGLSSITQTVANPTIHELSLSETGTPLAPQQASDVASLVEHVQREHGRINVLVSNAAVNPEAGPLMRISGQAIGEGSGVPQHYPGFGGLLNSKDLCPGLSCADRSSAAVAVQAQSRKLNDENIIHMVDRPRRGLFAPSIDHAPYRGVQTRFWTSMSRPQWCLFRRVVPL